MSSEIVRENDDNIVKDGDQVILKRLNNKYYRAVTVRSSRTVVIDRAKIKLEYVIGHVYGSAFQVDGDQVVKLNRQQPEAVENADDDDSIKEADNRHLLDTSENQKLGKDDIVKMRKEGVSGEAIIEKLIENSATFSGKTEFSKEKYLKKKKAKHIFQFSILRPSARIVAEMLYIKDSAKICHLRIDTLSQILVRGNISANRNILLYETVQGLVTGAILERMGGFGNLYDVYFVDKPSRVALENFNFDKKIYQVFKRVKIGGACKPEVRGISEKIEQPVEEILNVKMEFMDEAPAVGDSPECQEPVDKMPKVDESVVPEIIEKCPSDDDLLANHQFDSLVICSKHHPAPILMHLLPYLRPGSQIVVFSQFSEPLIDCYNRLKELGSVINIKVSETWLREYQVLPNRTHPTINMSGGGGFLLHATKIELPTAT